MITTVDAVSTACAAPESIKQVAVADGSWSRRPTSPSRPSVDARARARLEPDGAESSRSSFGDVEPGRALRRRPSATRATLADDERHAHDGDVRAVLPRPRRAARLDRVRDLADDAAPGARRRRPARQGASRRRRRRARSLLNGVQHVVHPPEHLAALAGRRPPLADRLHRPRDRSGGAPRSLAAFNALVARD